MEYGTPICEDNSLRCDDNFIRHVGYTQSNQCIRDYFSQKTIDTISRKVTELLQGIDPSGRPIIVSNKVICSVMDSVYNSHRPETGDIYSRYTIPLKGVDNQVQNMINRVIEIVTSQIETSVGMEECNKKLTIWTTVMGDFNPHGLRQHAPIKISKKRPARMQFNMNY